MLREIFTMWRDTRMVVLAALTAALYAALLIPFKAIPIIPGITEVRPAVAVPLVFGALFGPAAAWGSGLGNLIGDIWGGTLSPGSPFGFAGNFLMALVPAMILGRRDTPALLLFASSTVLACAACAAVIAWGLELLGLYPFSALGSIIFVNNAVVGLLLGPVLLRLVAPRVASWHLRWTDILDTPAAPAARRRAGLALLWAGGLGALVAGLALSLGAGGGELLRFGVGSPSDAVRLGVAPFLLLFLAGCALV